MPSPLSFHGLMQQGCERGLSHTAATRPFREIPDSLLGYPWTTSTHTNTGTANPAGVVSMQLQGGWCHPCCDSSASPEHSSCRGSSIFPPTAGAGLLPCLVSHDFRCFCSVWVNLSSNTLFHCSLPHVGHVYWWKFLFVISILKKYNVLFVNV